jgi:hypothetical protein
MSQPKPSPKKNTPSNWTSLNDPKVASQFVKDFKTLLTLPKNQRQAKLLEIINKALAKAGVLGLKGIKLVNEFSQNGSGTQAAFYSNKWEFKLNQIRWPHPKSVKSCERNQLQQNRN